MLPHRNFFLTCFNTFQNVQVFFFNIFHYFPACLYFSTCSLLQFLSVCSLHFRLIHHHGGREQKQEVFTLAKLYSIEINIAFSHIRHIFIITNNWYFKPFFIHPNQAARLLQLLSHSEIQKMLIWGYSLHVSKKV